MPILISTSRPHWSWSQSPLVDLHGEVWKRRLKQGLTKKKGKRRWEKSETEREERGTCERWEMIGYKSNLCFSIWCPYHSKFGTVLFIKPNFLAFRTYDVKSFLVFIVPNAKYLAFETPDTSALFFFFFFFFFYKIEILF